MAMIPMARVSWLNSVWLVAIPAVVFAAQPVTKITLDDQTRSSGYTLELGRMDMGIQPDSLHSAEKVWLRTVKQPPELPTQLKALSPIYSFTIQDETDWLYLPLQFQYQLKGKKYKYDRSFYYYDTSTETWQELASRVDKSTRTVSTEWGALHAVMVVAADTTNPFGPTKTAGYVNFGGVNAASAIVIDETTGDILYSDRSDDQRSIASMTKLMTAYVLFEQGIDLDVIATYHASYDQIGGSLHVSEGETMTMSDLMYAMVVGSANNAAYALIGNAGYNKAEFITLMNDAAVELGLENTVFADPSGLAVGNVSTAHEYAKLMQVVLQNDTLSKISATPYYAFTTINYGNFHDFNNTNSLLLTSDLDITGSKTGYIDEALYCLAMRVEEDGHSIITVVLGAPTLSARTNESYRLVNWAFTNYVW